jgi:hypothetical protein
MNTATNTDAEHGPRRIAKRLRALGLGLVAALALSLSTAGTASSYEHIIPGFDILEIEPSNSKAGGHPDVRIHYKYRHDNETECEENCLYPRFIRVDWPEGFIGNPHVTPKCTLTEFSTQKCPSDAQVGTFAVNELASSGMYVPVYNLQTRPDQAGVLGFIAPLIGVPFLLELTSRTDDDYGLHAETSPILRLPLPNQELELWGVPQSKAHDFERFITPLSGGGLCLKQFVNGCPPGEGFTSPTHAPATTPEGPFLQNPTVCNVPLSVRAEVEYHGGLTGGQELPWAPTTGCNQASFSPSITAKMTTTSADTASGLDTDLKVPQTQSPDTPSPSELKVARLTLPEGISINPNAADGKLACPEFLSAIGTLAAASCPEFSKIGTLVLDVAALPEPIPGALYLAEPKPGEPYRVLLAASGFATNVKLLGTVEPDPQTGQVEIVFKKLPQAPLQEFDLHVFGSERGLLASPTHCGTYQMKGEFVPWNDALSTRFSTNTITINSGPGGSPCPVGPRALNPGLQAGVANSTAGTHSPFSMTLSRNDGEQNLTGLTIATPPGFSASLRGVAYCPEPAIATLSSPSHTGVAELGSPACPGSSQIGTVTAGVGAGSHPLYVKGKAYFAGPYKGAPLSLVAVVPAVSGPYDLGNVVVRAAIQVDPVTARITTVSDSLPQILEGIPLRGRSILLNLDRSNFTLNPTNCDQFAIDESTTGNEGGLTARSVQFQVANCADLPFAPKLSLNLTGGLNRRGHPAVKATFTAAPGEANTRKVIVALPKGELLDNAHIGNVCTRPQFAADACPAASQLGTANVSTPLLDAPLTGNVYLRSGSNNLPDIAVDLEGQVDFELVGRVDTVKGGSLRTSFETAPDVPVTQFVLSLAGGSKGLLQNSESLCRKPKKATTTIVGQNGAVIKTQTKLQTSCRKKARHKRGAKRKAAR